MAKNLPQQAASPQDALMQAFKKDVQNINPYLEALLPRGGLARFQRMTQLAVLRSPDLLSANKKSLLLAILWCAQKNLEPGVEDGAWLIPFKGKVTPIPGYKGLINKAVEVGAAATVKAEAVYEHDEFFYCYGLEPDLKHTPPRLGDDRGKLIGAYVVVTLPEGEKLFTVMDRPSIEKVRDSGAAWRTNPNSGPWADWEEAMFLKTVIKKGLKTIPMKSELRELLAEDTAFEAGATVGAIMEGADLDGKEIPEDLKGSDNELEKAQERVEAAKQLDTSEFDALVAKQLEGLSKEEAQTRMIHLEENLKLTAKGTKPQGKSLTVPQFKVFVVPYFAPYKSSKGEPKDGYWRNFLAWEAEKYPVEPSGENEPPENGTDGGGNDGGGDAAPTFEEQKRGVVMEILKKVIPWADLEITGPDDITPGNIDDILNRVTEWAPAGKTK